jgi:hypothetical protein
MVKWMCGCDLLMLGCLTLVLLGGATAKPAAVLSVERLNIVDAAGHSVLVLSNGSRLPGATFGRKEYPQSFVGRGRSAGMVFFNEAGDEVGGLIYEGAPKGSGYSAFGHLSFDQWKQNQVVAVQYQVSRGIQISPGVGIENSPPPGLGCRADPGP